MKKTRKYSQAAIACVVCMSQGDPPTKVEFLAAWSQGLIDTTEAGERVIRETVYNQPVSRDTTP